MGSDVPGIALTETELVNSQCGRFDDHQQTTDSETGFSSLVVEGSGRAFGVVVVMWYSSLYLQLAKTLLRRMKEAGCAAVQEASWRAGRLYFYAVRRLMCRNGR